MKYMLRIFLVLLPAVVNSQVAPGDSCTNTGECVTNAVCIGTPNGACFCLNPYVDSSDGQTCVYRCTQVLNDPTNGGIDKSEGNLVGSTVTYSCDAGYTLNGGATRTCDLASQGWLGTAPTCDEIDECSSNPCQNSGFCNDIVNGYTCVCPNGFTDTLCETNIDECASNPCENGATCVDGVNGYTCTCAGGYTDSLCDGDIDECSSNPCANGACSNNVNSYSCTCNGGFMGTNCDADINECASNPCDNGATCYNFPNQFFCGCVSGYEDTTCSTDIDECASNPCQNEATCNDLINEYTCSCVAGYESTNCEIDTDECASNPCQNGATCIDQVNMYTCTCVAGFEGDYCETDTDECASNPCLNDATCNDHVNQYFCTCVAGYEGTHCEIDTDECASNPCQNGATCNDQVNMYICTCVAGYESTHCEINTDECASNPCQNEATCNDQVNQYTCTCVAGYESTHCEKDTDECVSNPCQNEATCNDQVNQYTCTCVAGYESTHCEIDTDECASNPCQNEATCNDQVNQYTCTCAPGYESTHCEIDTDECTSNPCQNEATCIDQVNMYACSCAPGYEGVHCEIDTNECASNPCQFESTCNDFIDYYNCTCTPGYADYNCDRYIDECVSLPCQNGGTCIDYVNYFRCECQAGYTDTTCRKSVLYDLCHLSADVCAGILNAECNGATCVCVTGYKDYGNATCSAVDCGPLNSPVNGEVAMAQGTLYQAAASFDCDLGYTMVGSEVTICQSTETWSEAEPVCNIKDCGVLPNPTFGQVSTPTGTEYLDVAAYSCDVGYDLNGVATVTCQADSIWSQSAPTCIIADCLVTAAPTKGSVSYNPNTLYQGFAEFSCDTGYTLTGNTRRQCQADGTWGSTAPTCVINDCGTLSAPSDGSVTMTGTVYRSIANFECNVGYDLEGSSPRTCMADTTWDGSTTLCVIKDCGAPYDPLNGYVDYSTGTKYLNSATFTCESGYDLNGVATRQCQADGNWQSPLPTCVIKDCGGLTTAANTLVDTSSGTVYNSIALYTCTAGYEISTAADKRTCQSDGSWSTTVPVCSKKDCGTVLTPLHGSVVFLAGTLFQATALFSCDTGYTLNGAPSTTCQDDATWSNLNQTCDIKDCGTPASPSDGSVTLATGTKYEAIASFSCDVGYTMIGTADHTCEATGLWQTPFPTCEINDCGTPTPLTNTQVDVASGTKYESVATYSCDTGYEFATANSMRTCLSDSSWSTPEPYCVKKDCGSLGGPTDGSVNYAGSLYQDVATYACGAGYTLNGVTSRTCLSTGVWNGTTPSCEIKDCGSLSSPTDGLVDTTSGTTYLQLAQYTCITGYDLNGTTTRTCQADGTWSSTKPNCVIKDCIALNPPNNGNVIADSGTTYGQTATYQCIPGYNLVGVSTRTCTATGLWSDSVPVCTSKDCGSPPSLTNGQSAVFMTTYLSYANYTCEDNYGLVGTSAVVCLSTGNWASLPECIPDCGVPFSVSDGSVVFNGGTLINAVATYTCDAGYTMSGGATITCGADGMWSSGPECTINCGEPSSVSDGSVVFNGGTLMNAVGTYTCDAGYTMSGGATITCGADGMWSSGPECTINLEDYNSACFTVQQCKTDRSICLDDGMGTSRCLCTTVGQFYDSTSDSCLTDCGGLSDPTNGYVTLPTQTAEGQMASYGCDAGYALSGNSTRMCQASGAWTGLSPSCIIGCALPDPPLHGAVNDSQGLTAGSAISYVCNTGYALIGQTSRICLTDSSFNGEEPTCKRECPVLAGITYGTVDLSLGNWEGSLATYICDKNYGLVGQSTRLCKSSGMWTGTEATCIFSVFPDIVLVFGALFIVLILVDLLVLTIFLYKKFFKRRLQKMKDEGGADTKKPAFLPFMVERPNEGAMPPSSCVQSKPKRTKFSKIGHENEEEIRNRKKPLAPHKAEKQDRFTFFKQKKNYGRAGKSFEPSSYGQDKENFKSEHITTVNSYTLPESVQQSTTRDEKVVPRKMKDEGEADTKKPAFLPFMVDRPNDGAMPPPSCVQSKPKRTKFSKIGHENEEEIRNRKKPIAPHKAEKQDRFAFFKQKKNYGRAGKSFEPSSYGQDKENFKGAHITTVNSYTSPESVQQSTARDEKVVPRMHDMETRDGYNTGNSDDNQKQAPGAEEDQMSLDDFYIPKPKTPMEEASNKFRGRLSMPHGRHLSQNP